MAERGPMDIDELVRRLNEKRGLHSNSHFSSEVYRSEPIIMTGRQLSKNREREAGALNRYREMRSISRWQTAPGHGRWLSEAEHFYRQARFMEDFEDDCPYEGRFASYFPTYNDMSDRQLRGYFTWRARVRAGEVEQTSLSFAYVYLYELICGIGVDGPEDGFDKIRSFWQSYRAFAPEIDRNVRPWLRDYVVYHGLDPALVETDDASRGFDEKLLELVGLVAPFDPEVLESYGIPDDEAAARESEAGRAPHEAGRTRRRSGPALPLPPDTAFEGRLCAAIDALSTYRVTESRLFRDAPDDLVHVVCASFVRMLAYYRKHRAKGLLEASFGEMTLMSYTMFGSAMFFEERPHPDCVYELDPIHRYRCRNGHWTCTRVYGGRGRSAAIGLLLHTVDRLLRDALGHPSPLQERKAPKYLVEIVRREIDDWLAWKREHAPRRIDIDLSKLSGIRTAAASTREALLIDEEREEEPVWGDASETPAAATDAEGPEAKPASAPGAAKLDAEPPAPNAEASGTSPALVQEPVSAPEGAASPLDEAGTAFVRALAAGDDAARRRVTEATHKTEDMLVDEINEALFDLVGDTVIEFADDGPRLVEDYRQDVEELICP